MPHLREDGEIFDNLLLSSYSSSVGTLSEPNSLLVGVGFETLLSSVRPAPYGSVTLAKESEATSSDEVNSPGITMEVFPLLVGVRFDARLMSTPVIVPNIGVSFEDIFTLLLVGVGFEALE